MGWLRDFMMSISDVTMEEFLGRTFSTTRVWVRRWQVSFTSLKLPWQMVFNIL